MSHHETLSSSPVLLRIEPVHVEIKASRKDTRKLNREVEARHYDTRHTTSRSDYNSHDTKNAKQIEILESRLDIAYDMIESLKRQLQFAEDQVQTYREKVQQRNNEVSQSHIESIRENQQLKRTIADLQEKLSEARLNETRAPETTSDELNPKITSSDAMFTTEDLQLALEDLEKKHIKTCVELEGAKRDLELTSVEREYWHDQATLHLVQLQQNEETIKALREELEIARNSDKLEQVLEENKMLETDLKLTRKEIREKDETIRRFESAISDLKQKLAEASVHRVMHPKDYTTIKSKDQRGNKRQEALRN